jgi:hypothetical protein
MTGLKKMGAIHTYPVTNTMLRTATVIASEMMMRVDFD